MTPCAIEIGDITTNHMELYDKVVRRVKELPDGLTCHQVSHQLAIEIPLLRLVRGYFLHRGLRHSWLTIPNTEVIIDPYPWASAVPIIITTASALNPWKKLYVECEQYLPTDHELGL